MGSVLSAKAFDFDYLYGYVSTAAWFCGSANGTLTERIPYI